MITREGAYKLCSSTTRQYHLSFIRLVEKKERKKEIRYHRHLIWQTFYSITKLYITILEK